MWARIENNIVKELTNVDPTGRFHPSLIWISCSSYCESGWIYDGINFNSPSEPSLEEVKEQKLNSLIRLCDDECNSIRSKYPLAEQLSWDQQLKEAESYNVDNTINTLLLDDILSGSSQNITKTDLVTKILNKATIFRQTVGSAIGKRQALEDQVNAATTVSEVDAIIW